ncbi:MAG: hypothetical protein UV64_C0032G0005 [Parcubacteria group bacterium GW2011_GWC1_43_11b]|nr:MAG: hypothetical protein UV64_C0032G0005 [Parcubacteria group bacterium GW2011_GWC1_43_11b]
MKIGLSHLFRLWRNQPSFYYPMDWVAKNLIMMRQALKLKIIIFAAIFLFPMSSAFAAKTSLEIKNSDIQIGVKLEAEFFLNTDNEEINAIEGKIIFSEKLFELKEIKDGNSIVNFWIERPNIKNGEILFSGIIPGGYLGEEGLIFSTIFQPIQEGRGLIEIRDIRILLNDGNATAANTTTSNLRLVISEQALVSEPATAATEDVDIPETFNPIVASDSAIFEGRYFLAFATQDKGSGIDHYEVREGDGQFVNAESPYLLQNQKINKEIAVKAVDKSGNKRIVVLLSRLSWYNDYRILLVLIITMGAYLAWKVLWQKFIKSR